MILEDWFFFFAAACIWKTKPTKKKTFNNNVVLKVPVTGVPRAVGVFSLADFLAEYRLFIIHIKAIAPPAGVTASA